MCPKNRGHATEAASPFVEHVLFQSQKEERGELIGQTSIENREGAENLIDALFDGEFPGYARSSIEISLLLGLAKEGEDGAELVGESLREFIKSTLRTSEDFTIWIGIPPDEQAVLCKFLRMVAQDLSALEWPVEIFELADIREELERQVDPFGEFELTPVEGVSLAE
jgi:hypothetical protein